MSGEVGRARVLQFSPEQQAFTATVAVPGREPGSIVARPDGDDAYVSTGNGLVHLDTSDETPVVANTIAVPGAFLALSPDDTRLYGVGGSKDYVVDLANDTVTATMDIAPGQQLRDPSVSADGTRLYMVQLSSDSGKTSVLSLDTSTNTLVPAEGVTGLDRVTSLAVGPDAHTFYVTVGAGLRITGF
ncbi:YncE family protein [Kitasatospora sp. NPDC018058]|uniref:YncE family protein n=1 Tax=Kitasatospora sp. NPDC018058 TaxID=3364025 RepID=UPI0037BE9D44